MKLQNGDYVTNLTEEQFNELMDIENFFKKIFDYRLDDGFSGLYFNAGSLLLVSGKTHTITTKLTFQEFKQRAINTFK